MSVYCTVSPVIVFIRITLITKQNRNQLEKKKKNLYGRNGYRIMTVDYDGNTNSLPGTAAAQESTTGRTIFLVEMISTDGKQKRIKRKHTHRGQNLKVQFSYNYKDRKRRRCSTEIFRKTKKKNCRNEQTTCCSRGVVVLQRTVNGRILKKTAVVYQNRRSIETIINETDR